MKKLLMLTILCAISLMPFAACEAITSGEYEYLPLEDGTLEIVFYYGTDADLILPGELDHRPVTSIGENAFLCNENLQTVEIPHGVQQIKWLAFAGCSNLTRVTLPETVSSMDAEAFVSCNKNLMLIVTPNSYAEAYCKENQLTYDYASTQAEGEEEAPVSSPAVDAAAGKTSPVPKEAVVESRAAVNGFAGEPLIANVFLAKDGAITKVEVTGPANEPNAFFFNMCQTEEFLGQFIGQTEPVTDIDIVSGATITSKAIIRAVNIACAYAPPIPVDNTTYLAATGDYRYKINTDGTVTTTEYIKNGSIQELDIVVPDMLDGRPVTVIGRSTFDKVYAYCKSIYIPESIKYIDVHSTDRVHAFDQIAPVEYRVSVFNPVYAAYEGSIYNKITKELVIAPQGELEDYIILDGTLFIAPGSMMNVEYSSITIPDSVISIGNCAFLGARGFDSLHIPAGVTCIDYLALGTWGDVSFVVAPDNPVFTTIDGVIFHKAEKKLVRYPGQDFTYGDTSAYDFTTYSVPMGIREIGGGAFRYCNNLTAISLPESVKTIGNSAFGFCEHLTRVNLPASVDYIGKDAFIRCSDSLTIEVVRGSYGEQYCKEKQLNYTYVEDLGWLYN